MSLEKNTYGLNMTWRAYSRPELLMKEFKSFEKIGGV